MDWWLLFYIKQVAAVQTAKGYIAAAATYQIRLKTPTE